MSDWTEIEVTTGVVRVCPKTGVIEARETVVPPNEVAVTASLRTTPAQRNALARALDPATYAAVEAVVAFQDVLRAKRLLEPLIDALKEATR